MRINFRAINAVLEDWRDNGPVGSFVRINRFPLDLTGVYVLRNGETIKLSTKDNMDLFELILSPRGHRHVCEYEDFILPVNETWEALTGARLIAPDDDEIVEYAITFESDGIEFWFRLASNMRFKVRGCPGLAQQHFITRKFHELGSASEFIRDRHGLQIRVSIPVKKTQGFDAVSKTG